MHAWRAFARNHRGLMLALLALALAAKALLPGGWMPQVGERVLTMAICADASGGQLVHRIVLPAQEKPVDGTADHAKAGSCAWSSLAMASLAGADAVLLAAALLFILALGFIATALPRRADPGHLRPPLRGPPAIA